MTQCIKNKQFKKRSLSKYPDRVWKKYFFTLNQKRAKKIKRFIGSNLNRNAEAVSLRFFI